MEHKLWLTKHRGFSSDGFASEQQSLSCMKEEKELSCWECMVHVNASVRANVLQLSKHLPNQIVA